MQVHENKCVVVGACFYFRSFSGFLGGCQVIAVLIFLTMEELLLKKEKTNHFWDGLTIAFQQSFAGCAP